jgi:tetratricopeptide (TPR) repeat protein
MRDGRIDEAQQQADAAVALAEKHDAQAQAAAHEVAARVALARKDAAAAAQHAEAVKAADASRQMPQFVRGRIAYDAGRYDEALAAFQEAASAEGATPISELQLYLGETLSHLDRYAEAEGAFRDELRAFPHDLHAYTSLAMLYRAMNRNDEVEDVLNELVEAAPTPEGYAVAARLWTILGERTRAEALRSDARARFPGDPSLVLLGRDARR